MKKNAVLFLQQAYELLDGNLTIQESLEAIIRQPTNKTISKLAKKIEVKLDKGFTFYEACAFLKEFNHKVFKQFFSNIEKTGSIKMPLKILLEKIKRKNDLIKDLVQSLIYPSFLLVFVLSLMIFLFTKGIPFMQSSGLIHDNFSLDKMYSGINFAFSFMFFSSLSIFFAIYFIVQKNLVKENFWNLTSSFANAHYNIQDCFNLASEACKIKNIDFEKIENNNSFLFSNYEKSLLYTSFNTGEVKIVLNKIANQQRVNSKSLFNSIQKVLEPLITLITGITILILSLEIFIPLLNSGGSFL